MFITPHASLHPPDPIPANNIRFRLKQTAPFSQERSTIKVFFRGDRLADFNERLNSFGQHGLSFDRRNGRSRLKNQAFRHIFFRIGGEDEKLTVLGADAS